MTSPREEADVAIVGGGPSGAALALRLARAGRDVLLVERAPAWRWRAAGVFSSPAAMRELRALGLGEELLARVAQPIPAMRVETPGGVAFRLTYDAELPGGEGAVGFDRSALDPALLGAAEAAGARIRRATSFEGARLPAGRGAPVAVSVRDDHGLHRVEARVLVGADGLRSTVARATGVARPPRLGGRVGLTFHLADPAADTPRDARMVILPGAYCGIAPVPGGRVNIGIVLFDPRWRARLAADGPAATAAAVLQRLPATPPDGPGDGWRDREAVDAITGAAPLGSRVAQRAGNGWVLVGDAAGFLDPFTGEGLHRAFVSARLAAAVIEAHLDAPGRATLLQYDTAMRMRFAAKDVVSLVVQRFLERPTLFEYAARRLATRERVRATMGSVIGDLVPASRALDPRFLARLLAP
ncbi:MAG TPA: NAD(P)/FAD-dependent oxidoreductase [Candidatus Limnocylindrales bacterium]|nr:NAD(P)/FAD-dependent oxidoreductase [Candidatus Limnocylindrales bacterium]